MPIRYRSLSVPFPTGKATYRDGTEYFVNGTQTYGTMTDVTGNYGAENPLDAYKRSADYQPINGDVLFANGSLAWSLQDYIPDVARSTGYPSLSLGTSFRSEAGGIASSHPGSGDVELPVFLYELKDLPGMLKDAYQKGRALERAAKGNTKAAIGRYMSNPKNPAQDWLNYNFGWRPFIQDAISIAGLSNSIAKHSNTLRKWSKGHISRTAQLGSNSNSASGTVSYDNRIGILCDYHTTAHNRRWVVSHWTIDEFSYNALLTDRSTQINRALGMDAGIHHVWNAMPYTWLTDWFVDIGSIIEVRSNRFGFRYRGGSVMTNTVRETKYVPRPKQGIPAVSPVTIRHEWKLRGSASLNVAHNSSIPFFSGGQLATLSSLAVTRGRGSRAFNT